MHPLYLSRQFGVLAKNYEIEPDGAWVPLVDRQAFYFGIPDGMTDVVDHFKLIVNRKKTEEFQLRFRRTINTRHWK